MTILNPINKSHKITIKSSNLLCISIMFASLFLASCNFDTRASGRSGTYQDDYLENPINEDFIEYKNALSVSNELIELMKKGDSQAIADNYVLEELKPLLGAKELAKVIKDAEAKYGKIVEYKPMQWGFEPRVENGKRDKSKFNKIIAEKYGNKKSGKKIPILFSVKVIKHEKAMVNYWFQFPADGKHDRILGVFYREKKGTRSIGNF